MTSATLILLDGRAAHTAGVTSLRAACDALLAAPDRVISVSVSGRLPEDSATLPILRLAERLAIAHAFVLDLHLEPDTFHVRFRRSQPATQMEG